VAFYCPQNVGGETSHVCAAPEREPSPFSAERAREVDFEADRLARALNELSAAAIEFLGPMMWAALIVLLIQAEFFGS
jgi:hypothetical protein